MADSDLNRKLPYRDPRENRTATYVLWAAAALVAVGVIAWATSDTAPDNRSAQTQTEAPATNPEQ